MTFRKLEKNTDNLEKSNNMYGELKTVGRRNLFNYLSSIGKVTDLRNDTSTSGSATITNANGEYNISLTANGADGAKLGTEERGRYSPGEVAEGGIGIRTDGRPTGNQEWTAGMYDDSDGFYFGEDSTGYYVARLNGGTETKIRQSNWNQDTLDGSGDENNPSGVNLDMDDGHVLRMDYSWYGHGEVKYRVVVNNPREDNPKNQEVITVHSIYPTGGTTTQQANLPVRANVDNNGTATAYDLFVAGRQFTVLGDGKAATRKNGETRFSQTVGTTWTPLISFNRKNGEDNIPVRTSGFKVITDTTLEYAILLQDEETELNNANFTSPTHTSASETVVDVDTSADGFSTIGERRFVDIIEGGKNNDTQSTDASLSFDLPEGDVITLAARSTAAGATVSSVLRWEEDF